MNKEPNNPALVAAKAILETRGNVPRLYRNTLVFLAVDRTRLQDLDEAVRRYLAWESILAEQEGLDLSPHQVRQAETQRTSAEATILARIPEAYQWLLVPEQLSPQGSMEWQAYRLSGQEALAVRASRKLRSDDQLITSYAATPLRMELDSVPLWRGDHVAIRQVVEDFARYLYLPRLKEPEVLLAAMQDGLALLTWEQETFAYAESFDESGNRYLGLRCGQQVTIPDRDTPGLLVKPEAARRQIERETAKPLPPAGDKTDGKPGAGGDKPVPPAPDQVTGPDPAPDETERAAKPRRFYGSVELDAACVTRDAGQIAEEIIAHLEGLVGAAVKITLEIEAEIPDGVPDNVVRIVTENSQALRFKNHGFEKE